MAFVQDPSGLCDILFCFVVVCINDGHLIDLGILLNQLLHVHGRLVPITTTVLKEKGFNHL